MNTSIVFSPNYKRNNSDLWWQADSTGRVGLKPCWCCFSCTNASENIHSKDVVDDFQSSFKPFQAKTLKLELHLHNRPDSQSVLHRGFYFDTQCNNNPLLQFMCSPIDMASRPLLENTHFYLIFCVVSSLHFSKLFKYDALFFSENFLKG